MNAETVCCCGSVPAVNPNKDCERCCLVWFAHQTTLMRAAQIRFFKTRKGIDLQESKRLETLVDQAISRLSEIPAQQELF